MKDLFSCVCVCVCVKEAVKAKGEAVSHHVHAGNQNQLLGESRVHSWPLFPHPFLNIVSVAFHIAKGNLSASNPPVSTLQVLKQYA